MHCGGLAPYRRAAAIGRHPEVRQPPHGCPRTWRDDGSGRRQTGHARLHPLGGRNGARIVEFTRWAGRGDACRSARPAPRLARHRGAHSHPIGGWLRHRGLARGRARSRPAALRAFAPPNAVPRRPPRRSARESHRAATDPPGHTNAPRAPPTDPGGQFRPEFGPRWASCASRTDLLGQEVTAHARGHDLAGQFRPGVTPRVGSHLWGLARPFGCLQDRRHGD